MRAQVLHIDPAKARIFLSIRRTTASPLLETLDSLTTAAAAAAAAAAQAAASGGGGGGGSASEAAAMDQRAALGDLPEAVRFCEVLLQQGRGAVLSAAPGVRLQGRAASQELEVYMVRRGGGAGCRESPRLAAGAGHSRATLCG